MYPDIPWNLFDISPGAREAASAAARSEGLSIGEWLTRQIAKGFSEHDTSDFALPDDRRMNPSVEWTDRSESGGHASMGLTCDSVMKLQDGLSRLANDMVQTAGHSAIQISGLSNNLKALGDQLEGVKTDALRATGSLEQRLEQDFAGVRQEIETLGVRQNDARHTVAGALQAVGERLERATADASGATTALEQQLRDRLTVLAHGLESLGERQHSASVSLGGNVEALARRMDAIRAESCGTTGALEQHLATLQQALDSLRVHHENCSKEVSGNLQLLTESLASVRSEASGATGSLEQRLTSLQQSLESFDCRHNHTARTLTDAVDRVTSRVAGIRAEAAAATNSLEQRLAALQRGHENLDTRQDGAMRTVADNLGLLTSQLGAATSAASAATLSLEQRLETRLAAVQHSLKFLDERQDGASQSIADNLAFLTARLDEVTTAASAATGLLEQQVEQRLGTIQQGLTNLSDRQEDVCRTYSGNFDSLKTHLGELKTETTEALGSLLQTVTSLDQRFDQRFEAANRELETRSDIQDNKSRALAHSLQSVTGRLDTAVSEVSALRQGLDCLGHQHINSSQSLTENLQTLSNRLENAEAEASRTMGLLVQRFEQHLENERQEVKSLGERQTDSSQTLSQQFLELVQRMDFALSDVSRSMGTLGHRVEQGLATAQQDQKTLDSRQQEVSQTLAALQMQNTSAAEIVANADGNIRKPELDAGQHALNDRIGNMERQLSLLEGRANATEHSLSILPPTASAVDATLRAINERLRIVEKKQADVIAELKAGLQMLRTTSGEIPAPSGSQPFPVNGAAQAIAMGSVEITAVQAVPVAQASNGTVEAPGDLGPTSSAQTANDPAPPVMGPSHGDSAPEPRDCSSPELPPFFQPAPVLVSAFNSLEQTADKQFASLNGVAGADDSDQRLPPVLNLSAARRLAQAAAEQAATQRHATGLFSLSWLDSTGFFAEPKTSKSSYSLVAAIALVATLAVAAGALLIRSDFTQRSAASHYSKPMNLVGKKPGSAERGPGAAKTVQPSRLSKRMRPSTAVSPRTVSFASNSQSPVERSHSPITQPAAASGLPTGISADLARTISLANAGNSHAQLMLGLHLLYQEGAAARPSAAAQWLERAATNGEAVAQYRVATLYAKGLGVPVNHAMAFQWYDKAAELGNRKAMHNLAVAYVEGKGTAKNLPQAVHWFSRAAELGFVDSQFNLAVLYERGMGVPQSLLTAYRWYALAAMGGDQESKVRVDAISAQLAPETRDSLDKSVEAFRPLPIRAIANDEPQFAHEDKQSAK